MNFHSSPGESPHEQIRSHDLLDPSAQLNKGLKKELKVLSRDSSSLLGLILIILSVIFSININMYLLCVGECHMVHMWRSENNLG